jgi:hypothetical protein
LTVKNLLRVLFAVLMMSACFSTTALADGPGIPPTCNPFTNPNCPSPLPPYHPPVR